MSKLKVGHLVRLRKEAVESFYGREERIDDYLIGGTGGELKSEDFVDFVNSHAFDTGAAIGLIVGEGAREGIFKVTYSNITGGESYSFYEEKDLIRVKRI